MAEYNYIAQSAFQANEDRVRAWQYFFVTFGTLIAAVLSAQFGQPGVGQLAWVFVIVFGLLSLLGLITVIQLARLRQAWLESVWAMNRLKARAIAEAPDLAGYFVWTNASAPPPFKRYSFGFMQAMSVALLGGLAAGAALYLALTPQVPAWRLGLSVAFGLLVGGLYLWLGYVRPLERTATLQEREAQLTYG